MSSPARAEVTPPAPGPYAIVLRGAGGEELARYPFTPGGLEGGAAPYEGRDRSCLHLRAAALIIRGIASLEIEGPGGVIFQVEAGLNLPAVQITSPNGGEVFGEEHITVSWTCQR